MAKPWVSIFPQETLSCSKSQRAPKRRSTAYPSPNITRLRGCSRKARPEDVV